MNYVKGGAIAITAHGGPPITGSRISWTQDETAKYSPNCTSIVCLIVDVAFQEDVPSGSTYKMVLKNLYNPSSVSEFGEFKISGMMKYRGE